MSGSRWSSPSTVSNWGPAVSAWPAESASLSAPSRGPVQTGRPVAGSVRHDACMSDATNSLETNKLDGERLDILETLDKHRGFLRHTAKGLTDSEAGRRTTVSELCVGGIIKHVTEMEINWAQ